MNEAQLSVTFHRKSGFLEWKLAPLGGSVQKSSSVNLGDGNFDRAIQSFFAAWREIQGAGDRAAKKQHLERAARDLQFELVPKELDLKTLGPSGTTVRIALDPDCIPLEVVPLLEREYTPFSSWFKLYFAKVDRQHSISRVCPPRTDTGGSPQVMAVGNAFTAEPVARHTDISSDSDQRVGVHAERIASSLEGLYGTPAELTRVTRDSAPQDPAVCFRRAYESLNGGCLYHFGHGVQGDEAGLDLAGARLKVSELEKGLSESCDQPVDFAFINACWSAVLAAPGQTDLAQVLLRSGVTALIGTILPPRANDAASFAERFFDCLTDFRRDLFAAFHSVAKEAWNSWKNVGDGNLNWATHRIYGVWERRFLRTPVSTSDGGFVLTLDNGQKIDFGLLELHRPDHIANLARCNGCTIDEVFGALDVAPELHASPAVVSIPSDALLAGVERLNPGFLKVLYEHQSQTNHPLTPDDFRTSVRAIFESGRRGISGNVDDAVLKAMFRLRADALRPLGEAFRKRLIERSPAPNKRDKLREVGKSRAGPLVGWAWHISRKAGSPRIETAHLLSAVLTLAVLDAVRETTGVSPGPPHRHADGPARELAHDHEMVPEDPETIAEDALEHLYHARGATHDGEPFWLALLSQLAGDHSEPLISDLKSRGIDFALIQKTAAGKRLEERARARMPKIIQRGARLLGDPVWELPQLTEPWNNVIATAASDLQEKRLAAVLAPWGPTCGSELSYELRHRITAEFDGRQGRTWVHVSLHQLGKPGWFERIVGRKLFEEADHDSCGLLVTEVLNWRQSTGGYSSRRLDHILTEVRQRGIPTIVVLPDLRMLPGTSADRPGPHPSEIRRLLKEHDTFPIELEAVEGDELRTIVTNWQRAQNRRFSDGAVEDLIQRVGRRLPGCAGLDSILQILGHAHRIARGGTIETEHIERTGIARSLEIAALKSPR